MPLVPPTTVRRKSGREMAIESRAAAEAQTATGFVRRQLEESKRLRGTLAPSAEPTHGCAHRSSFSERFRRR